MPFLRGADELEARLVHHTGSMIRFRTRQLPSLPAGDRDCIVVLPDGRETAGRFHLHPQNPYIGGPEVVGWIKSWVRRGTPVAVTVTQVGVGDKVRLTAASPRAASTREPALQRRVSRRIAAAVAGETPARRRKTYERFERDPELRKMVLDVWPHECQVNGCTIAAAYPAALRRHLLDVHHLNHLSAGGNDSPLNVCLICAGHHALIHRTPGARLSACTDRDARIDIGTGTLKIVRDATVLW